MQKKSLFKVILKWVLLGVLVIDFVFVCIFMIGSNSNQEYIEGNFEAVGEENPQFYIDEETGYYTFTKDSVADFKILQLTDSHIGGGIFCIEKDKKALDAIFQTVKAVKPDLIVFTGDITYPFPVQSGNINNMKTAKQFASLMEKMQVPWTMCFGNHDVESYSLTNREKIADFYASSDLEYCIFRKNPTDTDIFGFGNQIINIRNSDNTLNTSLVIFDSNAYVNGNMFKYDIIHDDQVEWYKNSIISLSTVENGIAEDCVVSSLAFFHIPLNEYQTAWDLYTSGSDEVEYLYGVRDEEILAPTLDEDLPSGKLFEVMVALGSTKATFCGHNHKNNFAIKYKGIQLSYSNSIVYLGLFGIDKTDAYRGGTVISIGNDSSFTSELVYLSSL